MSDELYFILKFVGILICGTFLGYNSPNILGGLINMVVFIIGLFIAITIEYDVREVEEENDSR